MSLDVMKQALEALEFYYDQHSEESDAKVITALRERLAQLDQDWSLLEATQESLREHMALVKELQERLAQPETVMAEYKFQTYAAYKTPNGEMKIGVVPTTRPATREEKIVRPGVYEVTGPLHVVCQCEKCKAQPEQEPVAWLEAEPSAKDAPLREVLCGMVYSTRWHFQSQRPEAPRNVLFPIYTTPPRREWVGLTDEERDSFWRADQMTGEEWRELFDAIEAKLKEKNA